jgi:hypothetical protein
MDRLNAPGNSAPHTATEMNFGLRSAGNGRLARHGRPGQGSTYLRNYIPPGAFAMQRLYCPSFNLQCSTFQRSTFQRSMFNVPTFNVQRSTLNLNLSLPPATVQAHRAGRRRARRSIPPPLLTAIVIPPERWTAGTWKLPSSGASATLQRMPAAAALRAICALTSR